MKDERASAGANPAPTRPSPREESPTRIYRRKASKACALACENIVEAACYLSTGRRDHRRQEARASHQSRAGVACVSGGAARPGPGEAPGGLRPRRGAAGRATGAGRHQARLGPCSTRTARASGLAPPERRGLRRRRGWPCRAAPAAEAAVVPRVLRRSCYAVDATPCVLLRPPSILSRRDATPCDAGQAITNDRDRLSKRGELACQQPQRHAYTRLGDALPRRRGGHIGAADAAVVRAAAPPGLRRARGRPGRRRRVAARRAPGRARRDRRALRDVRRPGRRRGVPRPRAERWGPGARRLFSPVLSPSPRRRGARAANAPAPAEERRTSTSSGVSILREGRGRGASRADRPRDGRGPRSSSARRRRFSPSSLAPAPAPPLPVGR